ncbi:hypothetical protein K8S19_06360 [bacterium]|nr:hypothetical protein [bacterium]
MITLLNLTKNFSNAIELYLQNFNVTAPMVFNLVNEEKKTNKVRLNTHSSSGQSGSRPVLYNEGSFGGIVINLIIALRIKKAATHPELQTIFHSPDQSRPDRMQAMSNTLFLPTPDTRPPNRTNDSFTPRREGPA